MAAVRHAEGMDVKISKLTRLSPLRSVSPGPTPSPRLQVADRFEPSEEPQRNWKAVALGALLGASTLAGALATPAGQALVQQVIQAPAQQRVEQLQGYAGDQGASRQQLVTTIQEHFDSFDAPTRGHQDGLVSYQDLHRVARDEALAEPVRHSAQALLADPILFRSLDVAAEDSHRVDGLISQQDLGQAWLYEQGGDFGSFFEVAQQLHQPLGSSTVFDYLAEVGEGEDFFTWNDLQTVLQQPDSPDSVQQAADLLTSNRNYFNALDVAADPHPGLSFGHRRDDQVSAEDLQEIAYAPLPEEGRQFDAAQEQALGRALQPGFGADLDWVGSFFQTYRGNCASTAMLKIALAEFGPSMFSSAEWLDGSYHLEMRDGFELSISPGELEAAATAAKFQGSSPEARALATLGYAAMAKRAWAQGHEGAQSYGQALLSLNNGENTHQVPQYLGLSGEVEFIPVDQVPQHPRAVVFGSGHAYYVEQRGQAVVGDRWGQPRPYRGLVHVDEGRAQESAFILKR